MPVTVEVPEGHKFCKCCGGVFPKESHFSFNVVTRKRTGQQAKEYRAECKSCQWERARLKRAGEERAAKQDLDALAERIADDCLSGEQLVYRVRGQVKWRRYGAGLPGGAELLGRFNVGADYRDLRGSLEA